MFEPCDLFVDVAHALGLPELTPGSVWLTGAGPGDPGLLTLHALNALAQADVVVHDALISTDILRLAPPSARLENVGKRAGGQVRAQRDISSRLVALAQAGHRVVRLKGGDPFVFGRGSDEALALAGAGIPFRIVPGITAGIGGLAYAGIPVTSRDVNHAVTFVTGHMAGGGLPDGVDWAAVARGSPVVVIYMGLKHIGEIADRLVGAGRSPSEPVAIVSDATLPSQSVIETTLETAAADAAKARPNAPAIFVIGQAVRLRAGLDWLTAALSGRVIAADPSGQCVRIAAE